VNIFCGEFNVIMRGWNGQKTGRNGAKMGTLTCCWARIESWLSPRVTL